MSARDDLDRFDKEWTGHIEWRSGAYGGVREDTGKRAPNVTPGRYVSDGCGRVGETGVLLGGMPTELRRAVLADLEGTVGALVDSKYWAIRAQLVKAAKDEARRTLAELESAEK